MSSELMVQITVSGANLELASLPPDLRGNKNLTFKRGDEYRLGEIYDQTTVVISAASVCQAITAVGRIAAAQPNAIDEAQLNLNYAYDAQCNLELSAAEIAALARVGCALTISCWKIGDDEETD